MLLSLVAGPAGANTIASVIAAPSEVSVGEDVAIIVTRSGVLDCAALVDFGDDIGANGSSSSDWATVSAIPTGEGAASAAISVNWLATPNDGVSYRVGIEIRGPKNKSPF